ncbi:hypothetical protein O7606_02295 [Micromonospora sp. WMMD882]|uniref:hypothetical protein n=1 Tax=Micromonospora sp. WMMD882 TaxID=3015151 RepID=UPI00248B5CB7|nr:hypothetical protein [Micromonospora sp. WMMD882]WBB80237.1 hypothetical protein O7606_02295 [Micromonospora sp. WMMD882]
MGPALAEEIASFANAEFSQLFLRRPQVTQYFVSAAPATAATVVAVQDRCDVDDFRAAMSVKETLPAAGAGSLPVPLIRREVVHMIALREPVLTRQPPGGGPVGALGGFSWGPWHQQQRSKWRIETWPGADVYLSIDQAEWDHGHGLRAVQPSIGIEANFSDDRGPDDWTEAARALLAHADRLGLRDLLPAYTRSKVEAAACQRP